MFQHLFLDIETIPAQRQDVIDEICADKLLALESALASIKPPGNYKKQETIDEWMATEAPKAAQALRDAFEADVDSAYRKTGLDGAFGQICVIGWALDDGPVHSINGMNEYGLLSIFNKLLNQIPPTNQRAITVVGHNVASFDLRYLVQRSIVNGIKPHAIIRASAQAKPWESDKVFDTMTQWAGVGNRISLDKLCKALNIPTPKSDLTGATVWDFVKAGRLAEVAEYCQKDVEATRQVFQKLTFSVADVFEDVSA